MNVKLEENGYVATPDDIQEITRSNLSASALSADSRMTYLRALVGTTQNELGIAQGRRRTVPAPWAPEEGKRQLEALEAVHKRFYEAVLKAVTAAPLTEEDRGKDRAGVYSRRANFARSSKSVLRSWLLSENSIRGLVAAKVTKYALQAEIKKRTHQARAPSEARLLKYADRLLERIRAGGKPEEAIALLETVISRLVNGLTELGVETTTNLENALRDGKMMQTKTGVFYPVQMAAA